SLISAFYFDFTAPPAGLGPVTAANYPTAESLVISFYDAHKTVTAVDAVYPVASYPTPVDAIDAIGTDSAYSCPARSAIQMMSAYTTVFQYEFNDPNAPMIYLPSTQSHPTWGAYHASEQQYLFNVTPSIPSPVAFTAAQQNLSAQMVGLWTQFARTGNPNASGSLLWPQYTVTNDSALSLDPAGLHVTTQFAANHHCAFWSGQ
ncbi:MAG: carboxylesterase family protein, partial [Noviherbaspirillum sp.]